MQHPRSILLKSVAFAALFTVGVQAQALRCDLIQSNTTCFDIDTLGGRPGPIVVPSNVTRLENEGIQLCQGNSQAGGDADIAYVYDNSGSMAGTGTNARAFITGTDTLFYYGTTGCTSTATSGTVTFQQWNALGTALNAAVTIPRLTSNAGCNQPSGDPYNIRGRAYRLGIQNQASRAPNSYAGVLSFTGTVANVRRPLQLNSVANVNNIIGGINAVSGGGTTYTGALDTSRTWLRTAITPQTAGRTKAIIFLSDGQPTENPLAYLNPWNPATPPVYGIFLGRDTTFSGRLRELATLSGGQFFLIPPTDPDSLVSVVDRILGIILVQYNPMALTITNTTNAQTSTGSLTQTVIAGQPVWRITLDNVIGLNTGVNSMSVVHSYLEIRNSVVTDTVQYTTNFQISTTGPAATATTITPIPNAGGATFATRCYAPSRIQWQTAAGVRPAFFTETDSNNVRLRLRTAASDSNDPNFTANNVTRRPVADAEIALLPQLQHVADSTIFSLTPVPMRVSAAAVGSNLTLEPFFTDSMIANWIHPRDARDFARDTIPVFPSNRAGDVWFSNTPGGAAVSFFPSSTTTVYIVVSDNRARPGFTYQVTVSSDGLGDNQIFALTETAPGIFSATVPITVFATPIGGDGRIQVSAAGDQLRVVYIDPVYNDRDEATAGFGISVEEAPDLVFTDAAGNPLPNPNTSLTNPVNPYPLVAGGSVYLRYRDDSINVPVTVSLTARSYRLGQLTTTDPASTSLAGQPTTGTARNWTGSMPIDEALTVLADGRLQGSYLIQVTAIVTGHSNTGAVLGSDTAVLIVARPDQAASLAWAEQVNATNPRGPVNIIDTLRDQDFLLLSNTDTVYATAYCPASGDSVSRWSFVQRASGVYVSEPLIRGALPPNFADRILACAAGDSVVVRYTDPVYGSVTTQSIRETMPPTANPVSGTGFPSTLDVTLSTVTPGAAINYTMNNTVPAPGQPTLYTAPVQLLATSTLEAVASAPNMLRSRVSTFTYTRNPLPSDLDILDANGNPIPVSTVTGRRTVTDAATALRMRLFTSQGGLGQVTVAIRSTTLGDDEASVLIDPPSTTANGTVYAGPIPLRGGATVPADLDDTLQAALPDMIIATWTNPLNAADVVRDTIWIEPAYVAPEIRFTDAAGVDVLTYPTGTTAIYVRVNARYVAGNTYSITVTSSQVGIDNETFTYPATLTLVNGVFIATIPVNLNGKTPNNGSLQVAAAGDQLSASFTDPVFSQTVTDQAAYNAVPEVAARIEFRDTNGVILANGSVYSPANRRVTVRYYDDWSAGINPLVNPKKPLDFTLVSTNAGATIGTDIETDSMNYNAAGGYWERMYPLADNVIIPGDGFLETQFRGALTVSTPSHTNAGSTVGTPTVAANLIIAYPDRTDSIAVLGPTGNPPVRTDTSVTIRIIGQPHTQLPGSRVTATVTCNTGDVETVTLVGDGMGGYLSPNIPKKENPPDPVIPGDGILTCRETDDIRVTYVDPVFPGAPTVFSTGWQTPVGVSVSFVSTADTTIPITSANDGVTSFTAIITTATLTLNQVDFLAVVVRTPQGDLDTIWAVETSATSGRFVAVIPFGFTLVPPVTSSGTVEGQLNPVTPNNSVPANVVVHRTPTDSGSAIITLFSTFTPSNGGYVRDLNGDGRADAVYLTFAGPITLPARIDTVYWNTGTSNGRSATVLSLAANGTMLVANMSANAFPSGPGMTGIPNPLSPPTAVLPAGTAFGGARVTLADSVGAVPLRAVKRPSDLRQNPTTQLVNPDTIEVTVSEPITSDRADWRGVFRFTTTTNCLDPTAIQRSVAISVLFVTESANRTVYTLEVGNALGSSNPLVGNCIFLDTTGITQDVPGNKSGIVGVPLEGNNPNQVIRDIVGAPPVVGLNGPISNVPNPDDPRLQRTPDNSVGWVAPIGFPANWVKGNPLPNPPVNGRPGDPVDTSVVLDPGITRIPDGISAVLVVTTSRYFAHINLFDHLGHFVKSWDQKFGYNGEMNYGSSQTSGGVASYLWWDQFDYKGRKAGQGVYIWKVTFEYVAGNGQTRQETRIVRTGLMR